MKHIYLAILTIAFLSNISAQESKNDKEWFAGIGLNAINNLGKRSPLNSPGDWANGLPLSGAVELRWQNGLAVEQSITINSFNEEDVIDRFPSGEDYNYLSFDSHVKYYFGQHIIPDADWIDFYGNAGVGFFTINNTNISFNLGGGILFWLNRRQTIGIRLQSIAKFAFDSKESGVDSNHFQTHLQAFFAL